MRLTRILLAALAVVAIAWSAPPLFGPHSGFAKARHGHSITVWWPKHWDLRARAAMRGWDERAGWKLYVSAGSKNSADVVIGDPEANDYPQGTYAVPINKDGQFSTTDPYVHCLVMTEYHGDSDYARRVASHELGHCLGFRHRKNGVMGPGGYWAPSDRRMIKQGGYSR